MTEEQLGQLLQTAVDAALVASVCIKKYFGSQSLCVKQKQDGSPVTLADQEAESLIRVHLLSKASAGPLDILGEEQGLTGQGTRWRWTVDPIDGTRSFVHGVPLFGTMIALQDMQDERPVLGVIHLPVLGLTYAGARGQGVTCNGKPLRIPDSVPIDDAIIGTGDIAQFVAANRYEDFRRLSVMHGYVRGYTDCFGHGLVVSGALGAMMDPALNPWDILPTQALIEEAGGMILLFPSRVPGKVDSLFGNRALVRHLARELSFCGPTTHR
ncbi:MAG: histidinol phosphate phosphatase [Gammaproteobacteria bacterium]|nr:histidinol phosphate phosphatase [Gammaproteobacteria bacterium]